MAILQVNYVSDALFRMVTLNVVLPIDKVDPKGNYINKGKKFKTLYLLHGLLGNYTDWVHGTRVQRWAMEHDLAVVMPSADNSFYVNTPAPKNDYGKFIGEELVQMSRMMFPLSDKREDTFIAGLSMGGYGAMRNGLCYSDTFSHIASFSGALHMVDEKGVYPGWGTQLLGDERTNNPALMLQDLKKAGKPIPKIYISCGLKDDLLESNRHYRDLCKKAGADVTYIEEPGYGHEWDFWDKHIGKIIKEWLPLDTAKGGIDSGNVKGEDPE